MPRGQTLDMGETELANLGQPAQGAGRAPCALN
jgi:hypothetical protein